MLHTCCGGARPPNYSFGKCCPCISDDTKSDFSTGWWIFATMKIPGHQWGGGSDIPCESATVPQYDDASSYTVVQ